MYSTPDAISDSSDRGGPHGTLHEDAHDQDFHLIVDSIPGLVAVFTPGGQLEFVNRRLLEYLGLTLEQLRGRALDEALHPEDRSRVAEALARGDRSTEVFECEGRLRRFDGAYRWHHLRALPLRNADGRIARWYNLFVDVDERTRAAEALERSELNLKLAIDVMPVLAWSTGPDGGADFFNERYLRYLGLSAEQVSGWGWTGAVHPDDMGELAAVWQRCLSSEAPGEAEARVRRFDGEYRWHLFRANPLRDESGAVVKWYGVNTDIEDQKRAEAELRRAYDSFAHAQRLSRTGSFSTDLLGDDHTCSEETYRILEMDPGTKVTLGRLRERIHPEDRASFDETVERSRSGADVRFSYRIVTASGEVKHLRGVSLVVEQVGGRPMVVGALQDVTEAVVAEEALNRARSELAHVARLSTLNTLTASIAHEVNQPLSGILTNASTCARMLDADPPNLDGARETVRRITRDGRRAADVTTRLRALFSKREFALDSMDLNDATREVIALSMSELQGNGVIVRAELAEDLPLITGDRIQLQQVLLNLIRNASDAMADVSDRPRQLLIQTKQEGDDHVRVAVRDSGVGIDPLSVIRVFEAFYTTKRDGMGIGLSVSRSIIERHRGRIWAQPNDGPGATIAFSIPRGPGSRSTEPTAAREPDGGIEPVTLW